MSDFSHAHAFLWLALFVYFTLAPSLCIINEISLMFKGKKRRRFHAILFQLQNCLCYEA